MGSSSISTTLTIKGKDEASAEIDKSTKAAKGLSGQLHAAGKEAGSLTGALQQIGSGDAVGAMRSLSAMMGPGAGLAGAAALGAAGVAGVAVAIGAAAIKVTEWSIELERLRAQMQFAFAGGEAEAFALADAVGGVAVESVIKLQTTLKASGAEGEINVAALQRITNAATVMGKTGDDALGAFADALRTGSTEALKSVGVFVNGKLAMKEYADAVGKVPLELTAAERSQAVLNATLAALPGVAQAGTNAYGAQDSALSELGNKTTALKLELSKLIEGPAREIVDSINAWIPPTELAARTFIFLAKVALAPLLVSLETVGSAFKAAAAAARQDWATAAEEAVKASTAPVQVIAELAGGAFALGEDFVDLANKTGKYSEKAKESTAAISAQSGAVGGIAYAFNLFSSSMGEAAAAQVKFADAEAKAAQAAAKQNAERRRAVQAGVGSRLAGLRAEGAVGEAARAAADQVAIAVKMSQDIEAIELDRFLTLRQKSNLIAATRAAADRKIEESGRKLAEFQAQAAEREIAKTIEVANANADARSRSLQLSIDAANDPAAREVLERRQIEIDLARELAKVQGDALLSAATAADLSATLQVQAADRVVAAHRRMIAATIDQGAAYAGAAKAVAGALFEADTAKRVSAGLDAALEGARAVASFAAYDIVGGIGHTAAALAFAKEAFTSAPVPAAAAGGGAAPVARAATPTTSTPTGTTTINLYGISADAAQVGVGISKGLAAAKMTGKAAA
jgi:hypothetical protein